jgi:serine/threonine protein kinase
MYLPAEDPDIRVIEPLGQGGTAIVARAFHHKLKREIALKYPRTDSAEEASQFSRLAQREFELIGGYRFPGFVRPLNDPGPNHDYLALELCSGPTLAEIDPPGDTATTLNVISAIAANLEFLRAVGLVHGDLKPQNVFLPSDWQSLPPDHLFFAKLSDFSLGRLSSEPDDKRLGLGTVGYMAPETIIGRETSHQSDLFALGVVAFQLLTGKHPFMEDDAEPVKVNSRIREQEPIPLAKLRPDLPSTASEVLTSLLAKDRKARPCSGWAVCQALEKTGAVYPFRKVLRPTFMLRDGQSLKEYTTAFLRLQDRNRKRLAQITDEDPRKLRLILSANFRRGGLVYDDGQYYATADLYWPHRLRQFTIRQFSTQPMAVKKTAVAISVIGSVEAARRLQIDKADRASHLSSSLMPLLFTLLRLDTVRQVAARYAPIADQADEHDLAAELHLKAGNLSEAERCADLAARAFNNDNDNESAIALLRRLELVASTADREFEIRQLMMLRGNIHKESGELDASQLAYDRIIDLYENRPPDQLLAEAYKPGQPGGSEDSGEIPKGLYRIRR